MPDDAWAHWTQGRGEKSVSFRDVILEGIDQIRKSQEAVENIRKRCEDVSREDQGQREVVQSLKHKIEIQLPSGDWAAACQRVGPIDDNPVRPGQLLAALIFESKSWKQDGDGDAEFNAGWNEDSLASSLGSLTSTTAGLSLERGVKHLALLVVRVSSFGQNRGKATVRDYSPVKSRVSGVFTQLQCPFTTTVPQFS